LKWWHRITGEMSRLRNYFSHSWSIITGSTGRAYQLNSTRVNYAKARGLYDNTDDDYKLGAGFAKKIVNAVLGFMGIPDFKHADPEADKILKRFVQSNRSNMLETERNTMRDGDCWVWLTRQHQASKLYPENETQLVYTIIPPEVVQHVVRDPVTSEPIEYVLLSQYEWVNDAGAKKTATIRQRIRADKQKVELLRGEAPPDMEIGEFENTWGFIPIIHFANDRDSSDLFGKSELEPAEPFMKAYHDIMKHAIEGNKMHSTPRLKLKLKDVAAFLRNNFGVEDMAAFIRSGKTVELDGHELLIFQEGEDASFIEATSPTGDAKALLELLFYCIVSASETPEFIFGSHTPSSEASVKEQMPVFVQKINRKREQFESPWQLLARMALAMTSAAENIRFASYETELIWDEADPRDSKEMAEELKTIVEALALAQQNELISMEAAVQYLGGYIDTMKEFAPEDGSEGEKDRIVKTIILKARLDDGEGLEAELEAMRKKAG